MSDVTQILEAIHEGDPKAAEELLPLVYEELRKLASWRMAREATGQTLQATALVHEAYLRLIGQAEPQWPNSRHFFSAAAEAMRRILVERARQKARQKYGGEWQRVDLDGINVATESNDETLLFVSDALEKLAIKYPVCAELIKLRFFAGIPNQQAAECLASPSAPPNAIGLTPALDWRRRSSRSRRDRFAEQRATNLLSSGQKESGCIGVDLRLRCLCF